MSRLADKDAAGGGGARGPSRRAFLSLLLAGATIGVGAGYALHRQPRGAHQADAAGNHGRSKIMM